MENIKQDLSVGLKIAENHLNQLILERSETSDDPTFPEDIRTERLAILDARINEARERLQALINEIEPGPSFTDTLAGPLVATGAKDPAPDETPSIPKVEDEESYQNLLKVIEKIKVDLKNPAISSEKKKSMTVLLKEYNDVRKAYLKMQQGESVSLEDLLFTMPTTDQVGALDNAKKWVKKLTEGIKAAEAFHGSKDEMTLAEQWINAARAELQYITDSLNNAKPAAEEGEEMHRISVFDPEKGGMTDLIVPASQIISGTFRSLPKLGKEPSVSEIMLFFASLRANMGYYHEKGFIDDALHGGLNSNLSRCLKLLGSN